MDPDKLRAWWSAQQGLDGSLAGATPAQVLERAGWARSVAGAGPYLTFFSRAGTSRAAADQAVAKLEIHELPAARGCTYVVPQSDFALALRAGTAFGQAPIQQATKLGVTSKELDTLCTAIVKAVAKQPLDPESIREAVGGAARNLGPEGKKKGLTTTLPLALGMLQTRGDIRRVPVNGRLDQQRYQYICWTPNPLGKTKPSLEDTYIELACRFFRWVGPATPAEFQWFSGLGVKASRAAIEPLELVPAASGAERLMFPDDQARFAKFKVPPKAQYALVSSLDAISATRRDLASLLESADAKRSVFVESAPKPLGGLNDLPSHAILDRGRVVGLWEYDVDTQSIAWQAFVPKDKALTAAVMATEAFVREQLQDARSFGLDSPKSREPRVAALRRAK